MKNRIITLLKAIGIVMAFLIIAIIVGAVTQWSYYLHLSLIICTVIAGVCYFYRVMRPKKRYYFVSYAHAGGFGATTMYSYGIFIRKDAEKWIDNKYFNSTRNVVVLYYKEISKEEFQAQTKGDSNE